MPIFETEILPLLKSITKYLCKLYTFYCTNTYNFINKRSNISKYMKVFTHNIQIVFMFPLFNKRK